ncbi:MAG: DMT family transporter [Eubacteriales bacterium]
MSKLIVFIGVFFVSFSAILVRFSGATSWTLAFYRMLLACLVLCPVVLLRHREELKSLTKSHWLKSCISGIFLGLHFTAYFESLHFTTIGASVVLADTEVFFIALLSLILWGEKISTKGWIGIGLTFLGGVTVAFAAGDMTGGQVYGNVLALSSAAAMSVYTLLGRSVRKDCSTLVYTAIVYGCAALTIALLGSALRVEVFAVTATDFLIALALALVCTLLGHSLFSWGLKYETPAFISMTKLLEPIFAALLGLLFFAETLSIVTILGGFAILAGIFVYTRKETT